jgi:hypothetical protein
MCQNPFGTQLKVKIFDVNTHQILGTDQRRSQRSVSINNVVEKWPTTVVLRFFFLDNEDLKDFKSFIFNAFLFYFFYFLLKKKRVISSPQNKALENEVARLFQLLAEKGYRTI